MSDSNIQRDESNDTYLSEGRYLYCLVQLSEDPSLDVQGIEDNEVYIIEGEDVGAVVHECSKLYDSGDVDQIEQWLVTHQRVIDAAATQFGTPLPFQFDVILEGGDEQVIAWLTNNYETVSATLESFADLWEYRVHVLRNQSEIEDKVAEGDTRLQELAAKRSQSSEGEAFLVEKQYEQRLQELVRDHRQGLRDELVNGLSEIAEEVKEQSPEPEIGLLSDEPAEKKEWVARVSVLAPKTKETTLSNHLDTIADKPGIEVRFTGPWPPYTFTPSFDTHPNHETNKE